MDGQSTRKTFEQHVVVPVRVHPENIAKPTAATVGRCSVEQAVGQHHRLDEIVRNPEIRPHALLGERQKTLEASICIARRVEPS